MTTPPDTATQTSAAPTSAAAARPGDTQPAPPCVLVIFGVTGDLAKRLLAPSLVNLRRTGLLPEDFAIVGLGRSPRTWRNSAARSGSRSRSWARSTPAARNGAGWRSACTTWPEIRRPRHIPAACADHRRDRPGPWRAQCPLLSGDAAELLRAVSWPRQGRARRPRRRGWRRVIVEKPFGHDLASARGAQRARSRASRREPDLSASITISARRRCRTSWCCASPTASSSRSGTADYVDHVQITVAETVGIEDRGGYYEEAGALRDMVQNHLLQLLALTAMEPPTSFDADAVRDEKSQGAARVRGFAPEDVLADGARAVRRRRASAARTCRATARSRTSPRDSTHRDVRGAQAAHRQLALGRRAVLPAHRQAPADARHRDRHPVQARAALAVPRRTTVEQLPPNAPGPALQPDEGISLRFGAKVPGPAMKMADVR